MKYDKFVFKMGSELLDDDELETYSRQFGFYNGFKPKADKTSAEQFFTELVKKYPNDNIAYYAVVAVSDPQPAKIVKIEA